MTEEAAGLDLSPWQDRFRRSVGLNFAFGVSLRQEASRSLIRCYESELGMLLKVAPNSIDPAQCIGEERDGLVDPFVGLGATEPEEAAAGLAEALAPQAGDAEVVVGPFQQVQGQAVRGDPQAIARSVGRRERRKTCRPGRATGRPSTLFSPCAEPLDLAAEPVHVIVARGGVVLEGRLGGPLGQGGGTRPWC